MMSKVETEQRAREEFGAVRFTCLACERTHTIHIQGRELSKAYVFAIRMTPCPCGGIITARRAGFDLDENGLEGRL